MTGLAHRLVLMILLTLTTVLASADAAADCQGPFGCVCMGANTVAGVIEAADSTGLTIKVDAVAPNNTEVMVGDTLIAQTNGLGGKVGERWFVWPDLGPWMLLEQIPSSGAISCVGTTFTVAGTLTLSSAESCPTAVRSVLNEDDDFGRCDDEPKCECSVAHRPGSVRRDWLLALALAVGAVSRRIARRR